MLRWMKPAKVEWISFLIVVPMTGVILNYFLFGGNMFSRWDVWIYSYPVILVVGTVSWYLKMMIMHVLRRTFSGIGQTKWRLLLLGLAHLSMVSVSITAIFLAYDHFHFLGYRFERDQLMLAVYAGLGWTLVASSFWEAEYTLKQWKESLAEKEKLEQLNIKYEFDTLKGQVNPHFLFNCFNTLSSLITEDKKQAEVFLNELIKVYRYLLKNNRDGLTTLQKEIRFIESYYQLLKTRHGEAVQLHVEVDKKFESYMLPSLSLQMLVENAVKHNVLSKTHPLQIDIFTTAGNKLVVSNNLQARPVKAPSHRIGLENIRQKYSLLRQPDFQVLEDKQSFSVVLPLIWQPLSHQKPTTTELSNQSL